MRINHLIKAGDPLETGLERGPRTETVTEIETLLVTGIENPSEIETEIVIGREIEVIKIEIGREIGLVRIGKEMTSVENELKDSLRRLEIIGQEEEVVIKEALMISLEDLGGREVRVMRELKLRIGLRREKGVDSFV